MVSLLKVLMVGSLCLLLCGCNIKESKCLRLGLNYDFKMGHFARVEADIQPIIDQQARSDLAENEEGS